MFSAVALQHDRGWTSISLATRACSRIQSTILTNHSYYPPPQFSTIFSILRYSINNNADQRLVLPSTIQFWSVASFFLHSKGALRDNHTGERGVNYGRWQNGGLCSTICQSKGTGWQVAANTASLLCRNDFCQQSLFHAFLPTLSCKCKNMNSSFPLKECFCHLLCITPCLALPCKAIWE